MGRSRMFAKVCYKYLNGGGGWAVFSFSYITFIYCINNYSHTGLWLSAAIRHTPPHSHHHLINFFFKTNGEEEFLCTLGTLKESTNPLIGHT